MNYNSNDNLEKNEKEVKANEVEIVFDSQVKQTEKTSEDSVTDNQTESILERVNRNKLTVSIRSFEELAEEGKNLPEIRKVFGNYILEKNTVVFIAERGLGKTFLALQLAHVVAACHPTFLGEEIQVHGNTLYLNMELGEYLMEKRLANLYKGIGEKNGPYKAYCISNRKSSMDILNDIEPWLTEYKPVLLVIDNLRTGVGEKNNEDNSHMTTVMTKLNELRDKYCYAVLLVHHTRKDTSYSLTNSDLQSGAGAISDLSDADFFMRRSQEDPNLRILKRMKSRNCEEQQGAKLTRMNLDTLWFELVADDVDESDHIFAPDSSGAERSEMKKEAVLLYKDGKTQEEIGKALGVNKSTISRWLNNKSAA